MRNDHIGGPDAGSRIDGGPGTLARRWADLGARSRDQARELDPPPLALDSGPPALLDARVRGSGWWLSKSKEAFSCFVR